MNGNTFRLTAFLAACAVVFAAGGRAMGYTWEPTAAGSAIKRSQFCELRRNVNDVRSKLSMSAWSWAVADPLCASAGSLYAIKAGDVNDIRNAIRSVYSQYPQTYTPIYSDGANLAAGQRIRFQHLKELRDNIDNIVLCGALNANCCATGLACVDPNLTCIGGKCVVPPQCGTGGKDCCSTGDPCGSGLICSGGKCAECGKSGELCCPSSPGPVCQTNLACTSGTCQTPMSCTTRSLMMNYAFASDYCPSNMPYVNTVSACSSCYSGSSSCPAPPIYGKAPRGMGTSACGTATCYQWNIGAGTKVGIGQPMPPYNYSNAATEGFICGYYVLTGNSCTYGTCGGGCSCPTFTSYGAVQISCCDKPSNPIIRNYTGCVPTTCSAPAPTACGQTTTGMNDCGQPCTKTGPTCTYTQNTCTAQCTQCPAWVTAFSPPGCWPTAATTLCTAGAGQTTTSSECCSFCPATNCIWKGLLTPGECAEPPQGCCVNNTPNN